MDIFGPDVIRKLALFLPVLILSLSVHEYFHAWSAYKLGDSTAKYLGRLSLDPMVHMSPFGTLIFPAMALLMGLPLFGWAKPVPVDMRNLKKPRSDMAIIAAAGPASNIIIAIICAAILSAIVHMGTQTASGLKGAAIEMLVLAVHLNLFLAVFNMIPVPPLHGSRIIQAFVGHRGAHFMDRYAAQGQIIILLLFVTGLLRVLAIPVYAAAQFLFMLFQIPFRL